MKKKGLLLTIVIICSTIPIGLTTENPAPSPIYSYRNSWEISLPVNQSMIFNAFEYFNRTLFNTSQQFLDFNIRNYHGYFSYDDIPADSLYYSYHFVSASHVIRNHHSCCYYNETIYDISEQIEEEYTTSQVMLNLTNLEVFKITLIFNVDVIESYEHIGGDDYDWWSDPNNWSWWKDPIILIPSFGGLALIIIVTYIVFSTSKNREKTNQEKEKIRKITEK